jgi:hypothetical protein
MSEQPAASTVKTRIVLWPTTEGADFDSGDTSLAEANADERRHFAEHYAGVPLLELMRRLRLAEWNAAEYQRQAEPLHLIQAMDARHKRVRALLEIPRRRAIPKGELQAALNDPTP